MAVAVVDVGKTNLKLLVVDPQAGTVQAEWSTPTRSRDGPPYRHLDTDGAWTWLVQHLRDAAVHGVEAIVPTTHGSAFALVDLAARALALPVMDYEAVPPPAVAAAYAAVAPAYAECFAPTAPLAMTAGLQLFWQEQAWPEAFRRAAILPYPQYWAWRLTGGRRAAAEVTSLGAQTHLWAPAAGGPSSLCTTRGWAARLPPLRPAWATLGPVDPALAAATGLAPSCRVLCGVHDSNANYLRYLRAGLGDHAVLSTGTWMIGFHRGADLGRLDPARDLVANVDVRGAPVASSRYAGGREFERLAGSAPAAGDLDTVRGLVAAGTMVLPPLVADLGGPFGSRPARSPGPLPEASGARAALAALYTALMADTCLELLEARQGVVVDGSFADNPLFLGILAALAPERTVEAAAERQGTAVGAALLATWDAADPLVPMLHRVAPLAIPDLARYRRDWRQRAEAQDG